MDYIPKSLKLALSECIKYHSYISFESLVGNGNMSIRLNSNKILFVEISIQSTTSYYRPLSRFYYRHDLHHMTTKRGIVTVWQQKFYNLLELTLSRFACARNNLQNVFEWSRTYIPTRLWGFSGHVQTILQSLIGRLKCPWPLGERVYISMHDGSTLTYDLYQPLNQNHDEDVTVAVCPGVGNSSESVYIRTFVHYAQCHGYRTAVLNHIGVIDTIQVTSARIFTYGHTDDYAALVMNLAKKYPTTHIISVGFSLGGNLVTKYLGEKNVPKPANIIGGISICQGYDATVATQCLLKWQNFQRFYLYVLTENVKSIIMKHRHILLSDEVKRRFGLNEREIAAAATLPELDEAYTRKIHGFNSTTEMYKWSSCINYLANIEKPIIFINALDDPLVPETLLQPIRNYAESHPKALYIECQHGGHLGFYEGGLINPNPLTWLDRILVSLLGGLAFTHNEIVMKKKTTLTM